MYLSQYLIYFRCCSADGFINGLAAVTQDALELSSSDVFLLAVVYDPKSDGIGQVRLQSSLLKTDEEKRLLEERNNYVMEAEAWKGGEKGLLLRRLRTAFDAKDIDKSGYLDEGEVHKALTQSGVIASQVSAIFSYLYVLNDHFLNGLLFAIFTIPASSQIVDF